MSFNVVQHKDTLKVMNLDRLTNCSLNHEDSSKHGNLLPDSVRCIITGPSNCGKTNVVFNLLTQPNGLHFNNVYIFSKSLHQPKYQLLEKIILEVGEVGYFKFNSSADLEEPGKAKPYSVFIFDDISSQNHKIVKDYFAMGRHNNIDMIYIGQTYSKIPKQLIRDNVNLICIFKQDDLNLKHIYNDHICSDMDFAKFKELCRRAWGEKYGFLVINKDQDIAKGRYRIGFDQFVIL